MNDSACQTGRLSRLTLACALAVSLMGCATTQNRDPLESLNRKVFGFNEAVDQVLIKPVATGYAAVTPQPVQTGLSNFINNIKDVWSAVNLFLQGRVGDGAQEILRVGINSTFGLAGLLDVASEMQLERHNEDLGQTLGVWGVPSGAYMVLPFFGPSTVRDTVALPADYYFSPSVLFREVRDANAARVLTVVHIRAQLLDASDLMSDVALDKYAFVRDAFLQRRRNLIYNGEPPEDQGLLLPEVEPQAVLWQTPDITATLLGGRADRRLTAGPQMPTDWTLAMAPSPGVKVAALGAMPVMPLAPVVSGPTAEEMAGLRAGDELR